MLAIRNLGLAGLFGLLITALPMLLGLAFAVRPNERWVSRNTVSSLLDPRLAAGQAEVAVLGFASFVFLTVGWLAVAVGMRKVP
jgi:hypothetical protein